MNQQNEIIEAELQIAKILENLEKTCNSLVKNISLRSLEITKVSDIKPQFKQIISIEMERLPGHHW